MYPTLERILRGIKRVGKPYAVAYGFMLNFKGGFPPSPPPP